MPEFYDQLNRAVYLSSVPQKIISIVPSQTELLYDLGLNEQIIGITRYCVHPHDKVKYTLKVGGTKQLNTDQIKELKPDLIIANKEENDKTQVEELARHFPVWISDINDLNGALDMIGSIGEMVNQNQAAAQMIKHIAEQFKELKPVAYGLKIAYLIWRKPYMAAGTGTFINSMLNLCGFENCFHQTRYPQVTLQKLTASTPDIVMLSSEPYPFNEKHIAEIKQALPNTQVILVDGEMFSWYGSRLLQVPGYLNKLINNIVAI